MGAAALGEQIEAILKGVEAEVFCVCMRARACACSCVLVYIHAAETDYHRPHPHQHHLPPSPHSSPLLPLCSAGETAEGVHQGRLALEPRCH